MNNPRLYNAAYSGALSGMLTNRVRLTSYTAIVAGCVAFATAVDAAIPVIAGDASAGQQELLAQLCRSAVTNLYTSSIPTSVVTQVVTAYNASAGSLAVEASGGMTMHRAVCVVTTGVGTPAVFPIAAYDGITPDTGDLIILANSGLVADEPTMGPWIVGPIVGGNATLSRPSWFTGTQDTGSHLTIVTGGYLYNGTIWNSFAPGPSFDVTPVASPFLFAFYNLTIRTNLIGGYGGWTGVMIPQASVQVTRVGAAVYSGGATPSVEYDVSFSGPGGADFGYQQTALVTARLASDAANVTDISSIVMLVTNSNYSVVP